MRKCLQSFVAEISQQRLFEKNTQYVPMEEGYPEIGIGQKKGLGSLGYRNSRDVAKLYWLLSSWIVSVAVTATVYPPEPSSLVD